MAGRTGGTAWTDDLIGSLVERFEASRGEVADAEAMAAYMRDQFSFLGIKTQPRRKLGREVLAGFPDPTERDVAAVCRACFGLAEREYHYFGSEYFCAHAPGGSPSLLALGRELITTHSWWDTVDALAAHGVGGLVRAHPDLLTDMDLWIVDDDIWVARTAIIHQLRFDDATDADRLFSYCERRAADTEFFIRKAIGWALRQYSKTDPEAVEAFVSAHEDDLSGLSKREALKAIERAGRSGGN